LAPIMLLEDILSPGWRFRSSDRTEPIKSQKDAK
jgi:hypothetical protein